MLRILKWSGTFVCALLAAAFVISLMWSIVTFHYALGSKFILAIDSGKLILAHTEHLHSEEFSTEWLIDNASRQGWDWPLLWTNPLPQKKPDRIFTTVTLPLLPLFLLFAAPTLLFWFLDRRRPGPGHCQRCNYDLTGNLSGICPECGAGVASSG